MDTSKFIYRNFTSRTYITSNKLYSNISYDEDGDKEELDEKEVEEGFQQYWENEGVQIIPSPKKRRKYRQLPGPKFPKGTSAHAFSYTFLLLLYFSQLLFRNFDFKRISTDLCCYNHENSRKSDRFLYHSI